MSAAIKEVVSLIESMAPIDKAYDWDNSGLLVKCADRVHNLLITLDVTPDVVREAVEQECDMILSHHPLIFPGVKSISMDDYSNSVVMELIRNGISLYSAHTSFDRAAGGMNDVLAKKLGLRDIEIIEDDGEGLLRVGELEKRCSGEELIENVKKTLGCAYVGASDSDIGHIEKIGVVSGSGGDFIKAAVNAGAQALVTGEAKLSHHYEANGLGILLIEAGHYETEELFSEVLYSGLQLRIDEVQLHLGLKISRQCSAPYRVV